MDNKGVKFPFGYILKQLRLQQELTLAQVCSGDTNKIGADGNGICDESKLSQYENGHRTPNWNTFVVLMQRLGEDPHKHYKAYKLTRGEQEKRATLDELTLLLRNRTEADDIKAELLISELENNESFSKDLFTRQDILCKKSTLALHHKNYKDMHSYALEGIQIMRPNFCIENINGYLLCDAELHLLNHLGIATKHVYGLEQSLDILSQLKLVLDSGYKDDHEKVKTYLHICYSMANTLGLMKRHDECISICDDGIAYSENFYNFRFLPDLLTYKGFALLYMRQNDEGKMLLDRAALLFKGANRLAELKSYQNYAAKQWGIEF